jgi:1-acyl-sn-glycerol-3-phosphate acyltransferase
MSRSAWFRFVLGLRTLLAGAWVFLSLVILMPIAAAALVVDRRQRLHDRFSLVWARGALFLLGICVRCRGAEHLARLERFVVVANHQGLLDIPALVVALQPHTPVRFVAKRSLFSVPILGWGMYLFGHIPLDRRRVKNSRPGLLRAQEDVRRRWSIIFFPEGTRTSTGAVGPFLRGAFHIAARARARVLPVTVVGSWGKLPRHKLFAVARGAIDVHIHAPLGPPPEEPRKVQAVAEACRRRIAGALPEGFGGPAQPVMPGPPPPRG